MFPPRARTFWAQKALERPEDCQDSIYPAPDYGEGSRIFAVADGSTNSFYAARWAEILTDGFADHAEVAFEDWRLWLEPLHAAWLQLVNSRLDANSTLAPDIRLIFENNIEEGRDAGATFAGLEFLPPPGDGRFPWRALAVGDACIIHLRADRVDSMPIDDPAKFDFQTVAISSLDLDPLPEHFDGTHDSDLTHRAARAGDVFILATDALAKWALTRQGSGTPVWSEILALAEEGLSLDASKSRFYRLIERARNDKVEPLANDDVALGIIVFDRPHACYTGKVDAERPALTDLDPTPVPSAQPPAIWRPERLNRPAPPETTGPVPPLSNSSRDPSMPSAQIIARIKRRARRRLMFWFIAILVLAGIFLSWALIAGLKNEVQTLREENSILSDKLDQTEREASERVKESKDFEKVLGERTQLGTRIKQLDEKVEKLTKELKAMTTERDTLKQAEKLRFRGNAAPPAPGPEAGMTQPARALPATVSGSEQSARPRSSASPPEPSPTVPTPSGGTAHPPTVSQQRKSSPVASEQR